MKLLYLLLFFIPQILIPVVELNYGDSLCFYQQGAKSLFYISAKKTINSQGVTSLSNVEALQDIQPSTKFYIQQGQSTNRFTSSKTSVKSGDFIKLEIPSESINGATYLAYDFSQNSMDVKFYTPFERTISAESTSSSIIKNITANLSGYIFQIFKINNNPQDLIIKQGDNIVLMAYFKNSVGMCPIFLGAVKGDNLNTSSIFWGTSKTLSNPTDFPDNYCWFISSVHSNASLSEKLEDLTIPDEKIDRSVWPSSNPSFSTVSPPSGSSALKYGDGIALKHLRNNFYLTLDPIDDIPSNSIGSHKISGYWGFWTLIGKVFETELPNDKDIWWIIEPGEYGLRFDPNKWYYKNNTNQASLDIGRTVRSGDFVKLEKPYQLFRTPPNGRRDGVTLDLYGSYDLNAIVSPRPHTYAGGTIGYSHYYGGLMCCFALRIYKKGAAVGEEIKEGDDVYFYAVGRNLDEKMEVYLASSNLTLPGLPYKEIFGYKQPLNNPAPSVLANQLMWKIAKTYPSLVKNQDVMDELVTPENFYRPQYPYWEEFIAKWGSPGLRQF